MDILTQLGIDHTLGYQFVAIFVTFLLAKYLFLNKLQSVIEQREEKTSKMLEDADKKLAKANELSEICKQKINASYEKVQRSIEEQKKQIMLREAEKIKQAEEESNRFVDSSITEFDSEINRKKEKIFNEVDGLAANLAEKLSH